MIDDITFCGLAGDQVGLGVIPPGFHLHRASGDGRPVQYARSLEGRFIWLGYEPDTGLVEVRLSVPKWLNGQKLVNYPLPRIRSVGDLKVGRLACTIAAGLGVRISAIGDDWKSIMPINRWAVVKVSYTADLEVGDPSFVLTGLCGLRRSHGAKPHVIGNPTETLRWTASGVTVKFYNKAEEILSHRRKQPEHRQKLELIAREAAKVVRFEVTLDGAKAVRRFWNGLLRLPRRALPTLGLMCDREVAALVITEQARLLGLLNPHTSTREDSLAARARLLGEKLTGLRRSTTKGTPFRERKRMTPHRVCDLFAAFCALPGLRPKEVQALFGWSEGKYYDILADLKASGLQPDGSPSGGLADAAQEIMRPLGRHLSPNYPPESKDVCAYVRQFACPLTQPPWPERHVHRDGGQSDDDDVDVDGEDVVAVGWHDVLQTDHLGDDAEDAPRPSGKDIDDVQVREVSLDDFHFDAAAGELVVGSPETKSVIGAVGTRAQNSETHAKPLVTLRM